MQSASTNCPGGGQQTEIDAKARGRRKGKDPFEAGPYRKDGQPSVQRNAAFDWRVADGNWHSHTWRNVKNTGENARQGLHPPRSQGACRRPEPELTTSASRICRGQISPPEIHAIRLADGPEIAEIKLVFYAILVIDVGFMFQNVTDVDRRQGAKNQFARCGRFMVQRHRLDQRSRRARP
jgi:hypothetical protein